MQARPNLILWNRERPDVSDDDVARFSDAVATLCHLPVPDGFDRRHYRNPHHQVLVRLFAVLCGSHELVSGRLKGPVFAAVYDKHPAWSRDPALVGAWSFRYDSVIESVRTVISVTGEEEARGIWDQVLQALGLLPTFVPDIARIGAAVGRAGGVLADTEAHFTDDDRRAMPTLLSDYDRCVWLVNDLTGYLAATTARLVGTKLSTEWVVRALLEASGDFVPPVFTAAWPQLAALHQPEDKILPQLAPRVATTCARLLAAGHHGLARGLLGTLYTLAEQLVVTTKASLWPVIKEFDTLAAARFDSIVAPRSPWVAPGRAPATTGGGPHADEIPSARDHFAGLVYPERVIEALVAAARGRGSVLLVGNLGAGQRTLARRYHKVLHAYGAGGPLEVFGVQDRLDTLGKGAKLDEYFQKANDGTFLVEDIDAWLATGDVQDAANVELLRLGMASYENVCVVATARPENLDELRAANMDLYRRFTVVRIDDYTPDQLTDIAVAMLAAKSWKVQRPAREALREYFAVRQQTGNLRNARVAQQVVDECIAAHRAAGRTSAAIAKRDVPVLAPGSSGPSVQHELANLIGMENVKAQIHTLYAEAAAVQRRLEAGVVPHTAMRHMIFTGNPGTGKTTVARLVGRVFAETSLLASGHTIEVSHHDLIAKYLGQTTHRVNEAFTRARGGVLFVDEAYSLTRDGTDSYGYEAIDTMVKLMEDHRDDLVVVLAGYTDPMKEFLTSNPGLASRFSTTLHFDDYSDEELLEVFSLFARNSSITLAAGVHEQVREHLSSVSRDHFFGNARYARTLFEHSLANQAKRLLEDPAADASSLVAADIPAAQDRPIGYQDSCSGYL